MDNGSLENRRWWFLRRLLTRVCCLSLFVFLPTFSFPSSSPAESPVPKEVKDKLISAFKTYYEGSAKSVAEKTGTYRPPDPEHPLPIWKHLRGNEGIPFVKVEFPIPDFGDSLKGVAEQMVAKQEEATIKFYESTPTISDCPENKTVKEAFGLKVPEGKTPLTYDLLFLRESQVPPDPEKAFGTDALLQVFSGKQGDPLSLSMTKMNLDCLPFRIRVTKDFVFRHYGKDALKKYTSQDGGWSERKP